MGIRLPAARDSQESGWAVYSTSLYTEALPLVVPQGTTATVIIDGLGSPTITSFLPDGVSELVDLVTGKISPTAVGNGYAFTFSFKASNTSSNGSATQSVNIGGSFGQIFARNFRFPRGTNIAHNFTLTTVGYALDTFNANGGAIEITSDQGSSTIWDFSVQVHALSVAAIV